MSLTHHTSVPRRPSRLRHGRPCSLVATVVTLAFLLAPSAGAAQPMALVGATVHPVSGPPIENGVVLVEGTTIQAVGDAGTAIPPGTTRVDLAGKHLYPGFIHPASQLGLIEIDSVRGTDDTTEIGDNNANHRAEVAVNADSRHLPVAISGGVLTAHVVPAGGRLAGTSAAMRLSGWNWEGMTLAAPVGMHLAFPAPAAGGSSGEGEDKPDGDGGGKEVGALNDLLDEARAYGRGRKAAAEGSGPAIDFNPKHEAVLPVLDGRLPLFIHAPDRDQITAALDWAEKQELSNLVLVSGPDAAYLGERLATAGVPVILEAVNTLPNRDWEPYDHPYTAAARLHAAGVKVALAGDRSANARNLPFEAAMAEAFGLPYDAALASVTLSAAEILGIADRVGSLAVGKEATLFVATGDPLDVRTRIERVWIAGQEVDLTEDPQRRLYERYRSRPRP